MGGGGGGGIKDLAKSDVRTLVGPTQGGRQPTYSSYNATRKTESCGRPSYYGLSRKTDRCKRDGASSHRRVVTPESERGLVSTMGPNGLFYANTVGTFGVVSAGRNWDRLASAAHRRELKSVGAKKAFLLLFSDDALFSAEDEISEESLYR